LKKFDCDYEVLFGLGNSFQERNTSSLAQQSCSFFSVWLKDLWRVSFEKNTENRKYYLYIFYDD